MNRTFWYFGLILVAVIWGANFAISRIAMEAIHPITFTFLRFGLTVPLFFIVLKWIEGSVMVAKRDLITLAFVGLLGVTVLEIAVMYTIKFTTLANASLLNVGPWPIFTALFAPLFTEEKITQRLIGGGAIALIGVAMIITGGGEGFELNSENFIGDMIAVGIGLGGALFNLFCMPLMKRYSPLRVSTWYIFFGVLFMFPLTLGSWNIRWSTLDNTVWLAIIYNALFATLLAFFIWNSAMLRIGATRANFFRYIVPATAVAAGYFLFNEMITLWQVIGGIFIIGGLIWVSSEKEAVVETRSGIVHRGEL